LPWGESKVDLESTIERDPEAKMRRAEIPWMKRGNAKQKNWKKTLLGFIRIKRERLACEVNSLKRAHKIRALIESALDEHARYRATEIQSMDLTSPDTEDAGCHAQALSPIGARAC
jgi:hypothetical protein